MMLPVTAWPPIRPGYWTSPFGAPAFVHPGDHEHGFPLPKGVWLVRTGSNRVEMIIRSVDPNEPYWRAPGTGIVHGMPKPDRPTWPDEDWHREGWPWAPGQHGHVGHRSSNPKQDTRHGDWSTGDPREATVRHVKPLPPRPPKPPPHPPHIRHEQVLGHNQFGTVWSDGQNVRIFGTGEAMCIKVLSA